MAQFLGSICCGMAAHAQDNVVNACTSVGKLDERRVILTVRVVQFVIEQGGALSANAFSQVAEVVEKGVVVTAAVTLCVVQFVVEHGEKIAAGRKRSSKRPDKRAGPTRKNLDLIYREAFEDSRTADPTPEESFLSGARQGHVVVLVAKLLVGQAVAACWEAVSGYVPTT